MIYAIDTRRDMLTEFKSEKAMKEAQGYWSESGRGIGPTLLYKPVHRTTAHDWVKKGYPHETGLWIDGGKIRYAKDDLS